MVPNCAKHQIFQISHFLFFAVFFWDCSVMKMTGNCICKEHKITKSRATSFCQKQQKNSWKWLWLKNLSYVVQEHLDQKTTFYLKKKRKSIIYLLKVNNRNTRTRCAICSKLTIKTAELRQASFFIVNSEHISHPVLVFRLLTAGWNSARTIHHHTYELSKVSKFIKLHHFWFWIGAWD